jgi:zinc/manganese transport system substrate-binding protein
MRKLTFLTAIAAGIAAGSASAEEKLKVVASFSIIGDMAARVGGERIDLSVLVGPDGDAHVFEPKPADAQTVGKAKLMLVNGLGFEGWLERLIEASGSMAKVVTVSEGVETITPRHEHGEEQAAADPHAWQSVRNAVHYADNIARALCNADRPGCETYKANAAAYVIELDALDREIRAAIAALPGDRRIVMTSHDSFGYFGREYGITFLAPEGVSTESEASAADVARLIDQIKADKASAIFLENVSEPRLIEQIGKDTGLKAGGVLYSDALSRAGGPAETYIDMIRHNARTIVEALAARS